MSDAIDHKMVSTLFEAPIGFEIVQHFGVVRGITVRSRNIIAAFGGALKSLVGGTIETYRTLCEDARMEAYNIMVYQAFQHGANCILAVRYDTTEIGEGMTEVFCYGTAVLVAAKK
ncbi:DUF74-domain-containing protein [Gonapodya prolifera JEL478]|uniref:DUF74-domain-containing protein n=1 Tax=Gonapodya prolifera (strain JEL478) TaxID=1344416 RepID=A0A139AJ07_GONPJ|nr:DUF74-domain-containing protein [Gonapodya prolifera JEL478]|eukprot:KXS16443.1 DUF74-domain-containing protein [Gonapodya prolifera JEL478]